MNFVLIVLLMSETLTTKTALFGTAVSRSHVAARTQRSLRYGFQTGIRSSGHLCSLLMN
ncbi:hypothetical protein PR003_g461 [Phytophthora rubi]|uniref:RxLR effector protein n=1 Tax=Phytophthora rubi TaxID=129364 RepID=A0A6A3NCA6_9STRA|nr:hypothetical protein PR001_g7887 [Phytophthora rubi]KAE9360009.1 hypothetical protein PR003_g461 [Phytophthora rubi]